MNKKFKAKIEALPDILGFVDEMLEKYECPMKIQTAICVAIEEVFEGHIIALERELYQGVVVGNDIIIYLHTRLSLRNSRSASSRFHSGPIRS